MGVVEFLRGRKEQRKKMRAAIRRRVAAGVVAGVGVMKKIPGGRHLLPGKLHNIAKYWTDDMIWTFVKSGGQKVPIDQPTTVRIPTNFEPRAKVDPKYQLTEAQVKSFFDNGFISPLKAFEPEEMKELLHKVELEVFEGGETGFTPGKWPVLTPSRIYEGRRAGRDRHLDLPAVLNLATARGVADQVACILGPDLLLWRTQLLPKPPGSPETAWHQATTFTLSGQALRPVMEPPDLNELFNVTAWLALEDVDRENGCMQFWRGSHKKPIHNVWIGRGQFFGASSFELEADIPENELTDIVLKAGEFIIFHERTVHGALPVKSQTRRRFGMNYRICKPDVYVYRGMTKQYSNTFGEVFDLAKWSTILFRGEDKFKRNRVMTIEEAAARIPTLPAVAAASPTGGIAAYQG